jgi:hypothetical protein
MSQGSWQQILWSASEQGAKQGACQRRPGRLAAAYQGSPELTT